uniref:CHCH domain-containing protein n=1 Tax=Panagrellus redivivus TaxID=6233 RepID=A0A7E4W4W2_PANRE
MAKATEELNPTEPPKTAARPPDVPAHGTSEWAKDKDEEDRVERLIKDSGCWDGHISVVDCMSEQNDWRKCQRELHEFRECMTANRKKFIEDAKKNSPKK